jgi:hypothetical protein
MIVSGAKPRREEFRPAGQSGRADRNFQNIAAIQHDHI